METGCEECLSTHVMSWSRRTKKDLRRASWTTVLFALETPPPIHAFETCASRAGGGGAAAVVGPPPPSTAPIAPFLEHPAVGAWWLGARKTR